MRLTKTQLSLFLALLLGNAIVLSTPLSWDWLRLPTAVALTFVLPGWVWLSGLGWLRTDQIIERIVLIISGSALLSALALLVAVFLPGPFTEKTVLIALDLATLTGLVYQITNYELQPANTDEASPPHSSLLTRISSFILQPSILVLLAILAVAAFTRLARTDYGEFHEDELENVRFIVRAYKGEEFAPFLDSKGPIHWLLPGALWYLNGWLNEGIAHITFAVASLALVPLVYALGRRISQGRNAVGLLAAGFVALNGFFVAYARLVENPSLIVLWGALAMWLAYRYYHENLNHFLLYLALTLALGLIAHPDVLLYLPVFTYMVGLKVWRDRAAWRQQWPWLLGAGAIFAGVTALFYVPYLLNPQIGLIYQYFAGDRIGESLFYNRLDNLFDQDQLYSSRYHLPVLLALLTWLLARHFSRWRRWSWPVLAGLILAVLSTVIYPQIWVVGRLNLAFAPYAVLTLVFILLPSPTFEIKTLFLWWIIPLAAFTFLAKDAADHIQIAYTAWALLSALALVDIFDSLAAARWRVGVLKRVSAPTVIKALIIVILGLAAGLIVFYQYLMFDMTVTAYAQAKIDSVNNPTSIYNLLYGSIPRPRKLFSNPRLGGWKAVGYLWATGVLAGDFRSVNESFATPIWYTFQTPRSCYDDPQHYWVRRDWQGWPKDEEKLVKQGYTLTRIVLVDGEPSLHLYEKNTPSRAPEIVDSEAYRRQFDLLATPARFAQGDTGRLATAFNFGDRLLLHSYDPLPATVRPGEVLPVAVYWESLVLMDTRYRAFVHLVAADGSRRGQHDDDPACRLPTPDMLPGQRSSRQFRLPVDPAAPPGLYRVILGLYDPATNTRLPITDNLTGQPVGDSVVLGEVKVE